MNANISDNPQSGWLQKRAWQATLPASGSLSLTQDSTLKFIFFICLFPPFISVYLFWVLCVSLMPFAFLFSNCFHNKRIVDFIARHLNMQTPILVRHMLWVGFSCLSVALCALEDALGQSTWACICPEGLISWRSCLICQPH